MCEGSGIITGLSSFAVILGMIGVILGSFALVEVRDIPTGFLQGDGVSGMINDDGGKLDSFPTSVPATLQASTPTLDAIVERGYLNCGVPDGHVGFAVLDGGNGVMVGFDADLCRAIAAAIFGQSEGHVEFIPIAAGNSRWRLLQDRTVDVLARVTTHTMERDVTEPSVGTGFEFSAPYLYNGVGFGGIPPYGACADRGDVVGECAGLLICYTQGTTHVSIVRGIFPNSNVFPVASTADLYQNLMDGNCNAIAEEQTGIAEPVLRRAGYGGAYEVGSTQYSKEPLAVATREGDAHWSDFVFWIVEALIAADEQGIMRTTATQFRETTDFGVDYRKMYQRAISDVGNYGEMYERHLQALVPRSDLNTINSGNSGLIYSFPFGSLLTVGKSPGPGSTIDAIQSRGHVNCGITISPSFGEFNRTTRTWSGIDVDMCRALSAALFDGVDRHVVYKVLPATERFVALASAKVDVLSRETAVTQQRDRAELSTGAGFSFSPVNFYDGLSFGGIPPYGSCADSIETNTAACRGLQICVNDGTIAIFEVRRLFPEASIVPQPSLVEVLEGLTSGQCNAIAGATHDISEGAVRILGYSGLYEVGTRRHSKEPFALVTREDDAQWTNFVRWIVFATFHAEEQGITQDTATRMPRVDLFGSLLRNMFVDAINAVGNYGEIYERNVEALVPRENGLNALNAVPAGPQQYPLVF